MFLFQVCVTDCSLGAPQILLRVWDIFFYEGSVTLFKITLGMLKMKASLVLFTVSANGFTAVFVVAVCGCCGFMLLLLLLWSPSL